MTRTTTRTYTRRLARLLEGVTPAEIDAAARWYDDAQVIAYDVAARACVPVEIGAGILAAFSPRVPWSRNITLAYAYAAGAPTPGLGASRAAADRVTAHGLDALTGPKVGPFARAILGDPDAIVIDSWMCRAAGIGRAYPSPVQRERIAHAVRILARRHGLEPRTMQALLWIRVRGRAD